MLAFNLSVFFQNLRGEPVAFHAQHEDCQLHFEGHVTNLKESVDVERSLEIELQNEHLTCCIQFEESDEIEETPSNLKATNTEMVHVHLRSRQEPPQTVLKSRFRFDQITLKPASNPSTRSEPTPPPSPAIS